MILFDYGQTLMDEPFFDGLAGTRALLAHASHNPHHVTAQELQKFAQSLNGDLGRGDPYGCNAYPYELLWEPFERYLNDWFGIRMELEEEEMETLFFDASSPAIPSPHIEELLALLRCEGIRTGVVSNLSFRSSVLRRRIEAAFPAHPFEFILVSSDYLFRKPHPRIFELALRKACLSPGDVWFCGDNPACDVEGAAACGIFPIWYRGADRVCGERPICPHLEINDWRALIEQVKHI